MRLGMWDSYDARLELYGKTKRERTLNKAQSYLDRHLPDSLSYHMVLVNGVEQQVSILNQTDMAEKKICALPGEKLPHGGIVEWSDHHWLITELDTNDEYYASGKMYLCNHLLQWLDDTGALIQKWSVVEDGTKYLIGEAEADVMTIGDSRLAVSVGKDMDTAKLVRGMRFLIDDDDSPITTAFEISKANKLFQKTDRAGVFRFILRECNLEEDDNVELRIANYYSRSAADVPSEDDPETPEPTEPDNTEGEVWL